MEGLCLIHVKHVLHTGCGGRELPSWLVAERETRQDIDPTCNPDILGSMVAPVELDGVDAVYSHHSLEHLHRHDVGRALRNFHDLLVPGGMVFITVPDLEDIRPTDELVYESPAGPVTGLDMYYGMMSLSIDAPGMMHKTGFVKETLRSELDAAGYSVVAVSRLPNFSLFGVGIK